MINNCWLMFARGKLISATRQKSRAAAESLDVVLKPNPANDNFVISTNKIIDYLEITDALGNEVLQIKNYTSNCIINTNSLSSGLYFVRINAGSIITYKRLIISK